MRDKARSVRAAAIHRWALLLLACATGACAAQAASPATVPVSVGYHRPTDLFNLLDNLPDWLPGYTASAYRDDWERRYGLDDADRAALAAYAGFRRRTSTLDDEAPEAPADLFAPASTREADAFSRHFLEAPTFEAGAAAAIAAQAPADGRMLQAYFARFAPRAGRIIDADPRFAAQRARLASQLEDPAVGRLAEAIRRFYDVPPAPRFVARFVWWPEPDSTQAKVRGRYILLHSQHDATDGREPMDWAPIVLHEFAHYLSAGQPAQRRQRLSAAFLARCPGARDLRNPLNALEEPLAIYWGQYRFEHDVRARSLAPDEPWYVQPWADRAAKAIARAFPATGAAPKSGDPALLEAAASACERQAGDGQRGGDAGPATP